MSNQTDKDQYLQFLLDALFFSAWSGRRESLKSCHNEIELQVTPTCNLKCKYCYIQRYGNKIYPEEIRDKEEIIQNASFVLDWLVENRYRIEKMSIFSGSLFSQDVGWKVLEAIFEKYRYADPEIRPQIISIPTNFTFLIDSEMIARVEEYKERIEALGIRLHLSGSVEGKYMEQNRPFRRDLEQGNAIGQHLYIPEHPGVRDDDYYERLFQFCIKHHYGFHPMVYSADIELWKKNFFWFQEMFRKYGMLHKRIFLLEVRNFEWNKEQVKDFYNFVKFLYRWVFENHCGGDGGRFMQVLKNRDTINMLYSPLGINTSTGIHCGIQRTLYIRLGDLHIVPCHRTSYRGLEYGKFLVRQGKIDSIEAINPELATQIYSVDHRSFPFCVTCPINMMCNFSCLGANLETTGDLFTPVPSVCRLQHARIAGVIHGLQELGLFYEAVSYLNKEQQSVYRYLAETLFSGGIQ